MASKPLASPTPAAACFFSTTEEDAVVDKPEVDAAEPGEWKIGWGMRGEGRRGWQTAEQTE